MLRLVFLSFGLALFSCWAQETGEITGRVVDASASVIPGATVEVRNIDTNAIWNVTSSSEGYYTQALLPPGKYQVSVHVTGFKQEVQNVTLEVQQIARVDFKLQVGNVSATIEITAAAPLLESSNASVG